MRKLLLPVGLLAFVCSMSVLGCSSKDDAEDPQFEADWVEDFETDAEEDQAQADEQAMLDELDDLDDVEELEDSPDLTTASLAIKKTPPKRPAHGPLSIIEDDPNFSGRAGWDGAGNPIYDAAKASERLAQAHALGADVVRVMVFWKDLVPGDPNSTTKPGGFVSSRPDQYDFRAFDMQIEQARAHGMKVLITLSAGPMPRWASEEPDHCVHQSSWSCSWKPNVMEYAKYVTAVGRHVKAKHYRIWGWTLVNEPNIGAFVSDEDSLHIAHRYRRLWFAGRKHLRKTAGVTARVFFSDQANNTKSREPDATRWNLFNNALCLELDKTPQTIAGFCPQKHRKVHAQGVAFHPYASAPSQAKASVDFLQTLVDRAADAGSIDKNRGLYLTESAFLTARGDDAGALGGGLTVTDAQQAIDMNLADRLLSSNPRVKTLAQYELVDEGRGTWDCGLRYARIQAVATSGEVITGDALEVRVNDHLTIRTDDGAVRTLTWAQLAKTADGSAQFGAIDQGSPKPAYAAYRLSIDVTKKSDTEVEVFGLARADTGLGFTLEGFFPSGEWHEMQVIKTDALGFGRATIDPKGATKFRIRFATDVSREAF
ncbi:MAG: hypothetical protein ACXWUG_03820 [Polyangiales bacterium]